MSERAAGGAVIAAAAAVASGAGSGTGTGVGVDGGGGSDVAGRSAYSLSKIDLAFPNNEHLLPISTFSTEQGLTVPSKSQVGMEKKWRPECGERESGREGGNAFSVSSQRESHLSFACDGELQCSCVLASSGTMTEYFASDSNRTLK